MTYFSEENVFVDIISNAGYRPYRDINVYESEREQIEQLDRVKDGSGKTVKEEKTYEKHN